MKNSNGRPKITIVGAGMSGTLMAIYLARRNCDVSVYEARADIRLHPDNGSRSFKMTLSPRGLAVLDEVGMRDEVMKYCVRLEGRMVHRRDGRKIVFPYGTRKHEVLHSITRNKMNIALLDRASAYSNINLIFEKKCVGLRKDKGRSRYVDTRSGAEIVDDADLVIGADGAFSTVRQKMHHGERADYCREFLDWGYKELTIPAGDDGSYLIDKSMLHVWARKNSLLLALPNNEGSFNCLCVLPFEGDCSFASLTTEAAVDLFFREQLSDVYELVPDIAQSFLGSPTGISLTSRTSPWYYGDRVVLIGDACHSVVPYYGQGMIAALEDCSMLDHCLGQHEGDWSRAFVEYERKRKRNTDTLGRVSLENFLELRARSESPCLLARKKVDLALNKLFPKRYVPLYSMIAHSRIPYDTALERYRRQSRIAKLLGIDLLVLVSAGVILLLEFFKKLAFPARAAPAEMPTEKEFRSTSMERSQSGSPKQSMGSSS